MKAALCFFLSAFALLLSGCVTKPADKPPISIEEQFRQADRSGDGRVSRDEFTSLMIEQAFYWMDINHSGRITKAEFLNSGGTEAAFVEMDRGAKGFITVQDAKASPRAREIMSKPFDEADTNKDGFITWAEFQRYRERAAKYTR